MPPPIRLTCHNHNLNMDDAWSCAQFLRNNRGHEQCVIEKGGWTSMCEAGSVRVVGAVNDYTSPRESVPCMFVGASVEVVLRECGARGGMSKISKYKKRLANSEQVWVLLQKRMPIFKWLSSPSRITYFRVERGHGPCFAGDSHHLIY
jgi:hypothetical protein